MQLMEQMRMIFLILRNLSFTNENENIIARHEKLMHIMIQIFTY